MAFWGKTSLLLLAFWSFHMPGGALQRQRYDGWYNNMANPHWGTKGEDLMFRVRPDYGDLTYALSGQNRPNARQISNQAMSGPSGLPSYTNKTTLFVFMGQMIAYELVHSSDSACPVELINVPVPRGDPDFDPQATGTKTMPVKRTQFNPRSGQSPNNPRRPINTVSSYIDGSFLYGTGEVVANCLRSFTGGRLLQSNSTQGFPDINRVGLPMDNFPDPITHRLIKPESVWMFGDPHSHQTVALTAIAVLWFRYHNHIAEQYQNAHAHWSDEKIYLATRRWVMSVMQNIIVYEWLPAFLGEDIPRYPAYQPHVQPSVSVMFESVALRFGHTMVPPGFYLRGKECEFRRPSNYSAVRLCNSYWRSQDILQTYGLSDVIRGAASQVAEREDQIIVNDLRGKAFGPLQFSRHDLAVMTIVRGRDHGLPTYNSVRTAYGLPPVLHWEDINNRSDDAYTQNLQRMREAYNDSLDLLDVFPAGLLEFTTHGPGPLFREVVRDQLLRVRDGDRFWFENKENGLFTDEEIEAIRGTRLRDVILATTDIEDHEIQEDVFHFQAGDPCPQPAQLTEAELEPCTPHQGFDHFAGSEAAYITAFTSMGIFPFVCVLVAYLIVRYKRWRFKKDNKTTKIFLPKIIGNEKDNKTCIIASEWTGKHEPIRAVRIELSNSPCQITVRSERGRHLRTITFHQDQLKLWVTSDHGRCVVLVNLPKEYDLVLRFLNEAERREFLTSLRELLTSHDKIIIQHDCQEKLVYTKAFTKRKRQEILAQFFRMVFSEASQSGPSKGEDEVEFTLSGKIIECELTKEEFAEALALRPDSLFVKQMFTVVDKDNNGYISFRELLHAVLLFSQGEHEDKMKMLFRMYDVDDSGSLSRRDLRLLITSILEMAQTKLPRAEVENLITDMFETAGFQDKKSLNFEDFKKLIDNKAFENISLDFKGTRQPTCDKNKTHMAGQLHTSSSYKDPMEDFSNGISGHHKSKDPDPLLVPQVYTRCGAAFKDVKHFMENNRQHIAYVFLFYCICIIVSTERFWIFAVQSEHTGLRSITGYGVSMTRAAAAGMSLCYSLLLLTMCRNTITALRETFLNLYVPFDSMVSFHKLVAWTALFFTVLHVLGYCFNLYEVVTQPVEYLCIFNELFFRPDSLPTFAFWLFGNLTGMTGFLLVLVVCIIFVFATQTARSLIFNAFWITHKLFYVLYILTLLHGASRLIQDPYFPFYFLGPAILFTIDKTVSLARKRREIHVLHTEILPSDVIHLQFQRPANFEYKSGQWVRVACLELGKNEYHPFTLTSAPHEDTLSLHIRAVGPWTNHVLSLYHPDNRPYPKLYLDGPYGAGQQDWYREEVAVLVGGGIGVTPAASILKDFVFMAAVNNTFKIRCRKLYFIWVTASQRHYEWLIDILREVEEVDSSDTVETHIFITQFFHKYDLRTTMLYICEEQFQQSSGRSIFTGLKAKTHFGRPNFINILQKVQRKHPKVKKIGVFSCGPPGLTKSVEKGCHDASNSTKTRFNHFYENF